jgi:hypothetical protein
MIIFARISIRKGLPSAVLALACWAAPAEAASLKVDYALSFSGLHVGTADLAANIQGDRYQVDIQARVAGLAGAFSDARGGATAAGSVATNRPLPSSYAVTSRSSSNQRTVRVGLAGGNAVSVNIEPPIEDKPDRVPVRDVHKRGVVDPVSALLMPVYGRGDVVDPAVCNRTLPVFDGAVLRGDPQRRQTRLRRPGHRLQRPLRRHRRPPAVPPGDEVHGGQPRHLRVAGADRRHPRALPPGRDRHRGDPLGGGRRRPTDPGFRARPAVLEITAAQG